MQKSEGRRTISRSVRRTVLLLGMLLVLVPGSAIAASPTVVPTAPLAASSANSGGFVVGAPTALAPSSVSGGGSGVGAPAALAPSATPNDSSTGRCNGWFDQAVSNVYFHTVGYRLYWDFYLTTPAQGFLGSPVEVTMPQAQINSRPINPPYGPHIQPSSYDFHASIQNFSYIGGGSSAIQPGEKLWMFWDIYSLDGSGNAAWRSISCTII